MKRIGLAAAVLVALAAIFAAFTIRSAAPDPPAEEAEDLPLLRPEHEVRTALVVPTETPIAEPPLAPPSAEVPALGEPRRWTLRGTLRGPGADAVRDTCITLRPEGLPTDWARSQKTSPRIEESGVYEVDLTALLGPKARRPAQRIEVTADHPLYMPESAPVPLGSGRVVRAHDDVAEMVVTVDFDLRPAAVITGTAWAPAEVATELVAVTAHCVREQRLSLGAEGTQLVRSGETFRLRLAESCEVAVVAATSSSAPATVRLRAFVGEEQDAGAIALDLGACLCGSVAEPPGTGVRWTLQARLRGRSDAQLGELEWTGRRYKRVANLAQVRSNGTFCICGFELGDELEIDGAGCFEGVDLQLENCPGAEEQRVFALAPSSDLRIPLTCATLTLDFEGLDPRLEHVPFRVTLGGRVLRGETRHPRKLVIAGCPATRFVVEVLPPEYEPWSSEVTLGEGGIGIFQTIKFVRARPVALLVHLSDDQERPITRASFEVELFDPSGTEVLERRTLGPLDGAGGAFVLKPLGRGRNRISVTAGGEAGACEGFHAPLVIDVELEPGKLAQRRATLETLGRLVLSVTGAAGSDAVPFTLVGPHGLRSDVAVVRRSGTARAELVGLLGTGENCFRDPLDPGTYELRIQRTQKPLLSQQVEIAAGQKTELSIDLDAP